MIISSKILDDFYIDAVGHDNLCLLHLDEKYRLLKIIYDYRVGSRTFDETCIRFALASGWSVEETRQKLDFLNDKECIDRKKI